MPTDARIIQLIRDGRDAVASMLADPLVMAWYRPSFVNVDTEFPDPFFGIESAEDRDLWPRLSPAGRCALRWRWSVRLAARLHHSLPSGQLKTIRYEHMLAKPDEVLADLSRFTGTTVQAAEIRNEARVARRHSRNRRGPAYETSLSTEGIAEIEKAAGEELRRLGYAFLDLPFTAGPAGPGGVYAGLLALQAAGDQARPPDWRTACGRGRRTGRRPRGAPRACRAR